MTQSPRLGFPYLSPAQVQKEVTHNEALRMLDLAVGAAVQGVFVNQPPPSPAPGACYIVGSSPSGAFAGHSNALAGYGDGGWRFLAPFAGLTVFDIPEARFVTFVNGAWEAGILRGDSLRIDGEQVVGPRLPAVPAPTGGTTVDSEARTAIATILARLRAHGLIAT